MKTCERCAAEVPADEVIVHGGREVCEDCAMNLMSPAKACDPWAVKMATGSFETKGDAVATLRGLEKRLYELVESEGRVPWEDAPARLETTRERVERAASVLRHMELLRSSKRSDGGKDLVPFDTADGP
jgi:hypothetical protein